ncbi:MAG: UDP-3-O-(3-hydroxymyristoyl)glucosamine N-acyltransferase [Planctomycetota bacterium]
MSIQMPLGQLAALLGGKLSDPAQAGVVVSGVKSLDAAGEGDLAFLWDPAFAAAAESSRASAIVCKDPVPGRTCVLVSNPQQAMLALLGQVHALRHPAPPAGVHPRAFVDPSAELGEGVSVGPNATVDAGAKLGPGTQVRANAYVGRGVRTGARCVIHPNATLLDHVVLGDRTVVWSGAVIGKDGFGFVPNSGDRRDLSKGSTRIPQVGDVRIGSDVEIGALTTVDRGALESTVLGDRVIVDSQVHVAHNCRVGNNTVVVGRVALAGAVDVGEDVYLLQGSAVGQGRQVGAKAVVGGGAQVLYHDVEPGQEVLGWPSRPAMQERRLQVTLSKLVEQLPDLRKRVKKLEQQAEAGGE